MWRGVQLDAKTWREDLHIYEGEELNEHALSSWSSNPRVSYVEFAKTFDVERIRPVLLLNRRGGNRMMSVDSAVGDFMGEYEYISSGSNRYRVISVKDSIQPAELLNDDALKGSPNGDLGGSGADMTDERVIEWYGEWPHVKKASDRKPMPIHVDTAQIYDYKEAFNIIHWDYARRHSGWRGIVNIREVADRYIELLPPDLDTSAARKWAAGIPYTD